MPNWKLYIQVKKKKITVPGHYELIIESRGEHLPDVYVKYLKGEIMRKTWVLDN